MPVNSRAYQELIASLGKDVKLVAVSKTKPAEAISELYQLGHRDFGENYVQELVEKQAILPKDIRWHFIGHLQSNKVKQIAAIVYLVHSVDSARLLKEIDKQGAKIGRVIDVLLQVHIAMEETKYGLDEAELKEIISQVKDSRFPHVRIRGLMGMASFTEDMQQVEKEFSGLKMIFDSTRSEIGESSFDTLSMGMSSDYAVAIKNGSNMVRIGSLLFGTR